jgi:hemoglobin-like flavoprotein
VVDPIVQTSNPEGMSSECSTTVASGLSTDPRARPGRVRFNDAMTPDQIELVESTLSLIDLEALAADFYVRAFKADSGLSAMFTTDPAVQRARFAKELGVIVTSIRHFDEFREEAAALGRRHRGYGVHAWHYRVMGVALLGALEAALGERWNEEVEGAWHMAYNLTAESMLEGAGQGLSDPRG